MWHVWGRREVPTWLWWETLTDIYHLEDYGVDEMVILTWILTKQARSKQRN